MQHHRGTVIREPRPRAAVEHVEASGAGHAEPHQGAGRCMQQRGGQGPRDRRGDEDVGPGLQGGYVVKDVLHRGESQAHRGTVDETVLRLHQPPGDGHHAGGLRELLDDRRKDDGQDEVVCYYAQPAGHDLDEYYGHRFEHQRQQQRYRHAVEENALDGEQGLSLIYLGGAHP